MVKGVIRQKEHLTTKTFLEEPTVVGKGMNKFLMKVQRSLGLVMGVNG